jgi:uncharacterized membrane protein
MLAAYESVFPGCAERIVALTERQSAHRQGLESNVINGNISAQTRGQYLGFTLGMVIVIGGIGLIAYGKSTEGLASIITAMVGLVSVFVYGRWRQERERKAKEAPDA